MDITVKVPDLQRELNLLEKIVGKKPTIAVLSNVLIHANMGSLILSATDLEIGLVGVCSADVLDAGAITLPAKRLMDMVRAQSGKEIRLKSEGRAAVRFTSGGFSSRLSSLPPSDFPKVPSMDDLETLTLPRDTFGAMLSQVRYAISSKDTRFYMNGAYMKLGENEITLVSTDGHRISVTEAEREGPGDMSTLIPLKAVEELITLCSEEGNEPIEFAHTERHLFFNVDGRLLISRMIDGKFPSYERMVPKDYPHKAYVDRAHLASALKRVALIDGSVILRLGRDEQDVIQLWSASAEVGDGGEGVPVKGYDGEPMELRFNAQYLLDFMSTALGETITMSVKGVSSPILLQDDQYLNVIMGMRA